MMVTHCFTLLSQGQRCTSSCARAQCRQSVCNSDHHAEADAYKTCRAMSLHGVSDEHVDVDMGSVWWSPQDRSATDKGGASSRALARPSERATQPRSSYGALIGRIWCTIPMLSKSFRRLPRKLQRRRPLSLPVCQAADARGAREAFGLDVLASAGRSLGQQFMTLKDS